MSRQRRVVIAVAALALEGVLAAWLGFAPFETGQAWLATLSLWIAGACGLLAWLCVPGSRVGTLLVLSAVAWGVANAASGDLLRGEPAGRVIALGWAAILVHAVVTFPTGRAAPSSAVGLVVIAGYAATALPEPFGVAALVLALVCGLALPRPRVAPASRLWPVAAGSVLGVGLATAAGLLPALSDRAFDPRLASEIGLVGSAILLSTALIRDAERSRRVENVLLELGPGGGDALTMRLASILEDPSLRIGYWIDDQARYVDPAGRPMAATARSGLVMTEIERDGHRVALLEQATGQSMDRAVLDAIGRAADLGSTNARLQADVERQRDEVDASRRRLALAADEERRQLTHRLEEVLDPRLAELESALEGVNVSSRDDGGRGPMNRVHDVRQEIAALARGLAPKALDRGLVVAISELAAAFPVPVTLRTAGDLDTDVLHDSALYFVCSEALANVAKHAKATTVDVHLRRVDGRVELEVHDDGVGGADAFSGSGLRGLRDRAEAVGGTLEVESLTGRGTLVRATVQLGAPLIAPVADHQLVAGLDNATTSRSTPSSNSSGVGS